MGDHCNSRSVVKGESITREVNGIEVLVKVELMVDMTVEPVNNNEYRANGTIHQEVVEARGRQGGSGQNRETELARRGIGKMTSDTVGEKKIQNTDQDHCRRDRERERERMQKRS